MPHDIDPIAAIVVFVQSHLQNIRHSLSEFSPNIDYHSVLTLKSIQHLHQTIEQCLTVLKYCFSGSWLVLLLGIPLVWSIWSTNNIARQPKASSLSIQALSAVFTPVCVAWPLPFASFFATSKLVKQGLIEIDTIALLDHICNGDLEFRDSGDLPYLFQGNLQVYGCKIDLYVPSQWILKSTIWILGQRLAFVSTQTQTQQEVLENAGFSQSKLSSYDGRHIDLDFIPFPHLPNQAFRIQHALLPKLPVVLEFSCLRSGIGFLTVKFLLCSMPFLPYLANEKQGYKTTRTSTPLFVKMQSVVEMFSTDFVTIEDIINVSYEHASKLREREKNLVHDRGMRRAYIKQFGLVGWREDRLMLLWEAGLLRSGYLHRWRMIIRKW